MAADIGLELDDHDRVFLTHGWADVVIVLGNPGERTINGKSLSNPLAAAFEIQKMLFQHFLISRTELILTANCLETFPHDQQCQIRVDVRVQECLFSNQTVDTCVNRINTNLRSLGFSEKTTVALTPGQMDFSITFGTHEDNLKYGLLGNIFKDAKHLIDRYETRISYTTK